MVAAFMPSEPEESPASGASTLFQAGRSAEREGDLPAAQRAYEQALAENENHAEWHYRLGCVHLKASRLAEAIACFRRASSLEPTSGRYLTNLGAALDRQGRREEAIRSFQKAIFHDDATAETFNNLGAIYAEDGRTEDAVRAFAAAVELAPDAEGYVNLGRVHLAREDFARALECCDRAVECDPGSALGHYFAGICLMRQGVYRQATRRLEHALRLEPRLVRTHFHAGVCLHKQERFAEARRAFEIALKSFPDDGRVHYRLALTCDALGDLPAARRHYGLARSGPSSLAEREAGA